MDPVNMRDPLRQKEDMQFRVNWLAQADNESMGDYLTRALDQSSQFGITRGRTQLGPPDAQRRDRGDGDIKSVRAARCSQSLH